MLEIRNFPLIQNVHTDFLERPGHEADHLSPPSAEVKSGKIPFFVAPQPYSGPGRLIVEVSRSHTLSRTTVGMTPLDEVSSLRRDLYLTTPDIHKRQASMSLVGFEPTIPAS